MLDADLDGREGRTAAAGPSVPVAIGGVGGSGTRVGAALLRLLGYHIGDDLNGPLDNLWFTLLFKRRSILLSTPEMFDALAALFWSRMGGERALTAHERGLVDAAVDERLQHDRAWLGERAASLLSAEAPGAQGRRWAWKEPNTHVVIDRLLGFDPKLLYLHFFRNPLGMAFNHNQFQLENWGPVFLSRDVAVEPRDSLSYWCAAHRRMTGLRDRHRGRVLMVDFDALCAHPDRGVGEIAAFLGAEPGAELAAAFRSLVDTERASDGRDRAGDGSAFDARDMAFIASLGYRPQTQAGAP